MCQLMRQKLILENLGFSIEKSENENDAKISIPSWRLGDIEGFC